MTTVSDRLRETIRQSGVSLYRLEIDSKVNRLCIARFLEGKAILSHNLDALCEYYDFELASKAHRKTSRRDMP